LNFVDKPWKNSKLSNFINILPVGAELYHADGLADMTKLLVNFRNFAKAPKKAGLFDILVNKQRFYRLTAAPGKFKAILTLL
jgi:hypothetical protein